jgi:hypothetical protein
MKKFKMSGGRGHPVVFAASSREEALSKLPDPGLIKHVQLPPQTSNDIITFGAKYVESRENLNRAYFANSELAKAYHSISYKALDIEHEVEDVVGHIYSSAYIDRETGEALDPEALEKFTDEQFANLTIDVVIGGVVYADRFPKLEGPITRKAYSISMETYFDTFDILLENGVKVTLEEAESLGLGLFVEQLMGEFDTEEDFNLAHTLAVKGFDLADKEKVENMKIYKYLKGILFTGGGLVLNPACPSCHILSTDRDEADCGCDDVKIAASKMTASDATNGKEKDPVKLFTLDLTQLESYMKAYEQFGKASKSVSVPEAIGKEIENADDTSTPQVTNFELTPDNIITTPAMCPNYKPIYTDPNSGSQRQNWCTYAADGCPTAGERIWKDCHRWYRRGEDWIQDWRSVKDPNYVYDEGPEPQNTATPMVSEDNQTEDKRDQKYKAIKSLLDSFMYFLDAHTCDPDEDESAEPERAAWTTKYKNGLPNSSFAVVETGYKAGESPKSARHLPFKDAKGNVDLPHLRNAMARMNQIKSVLGNDTDEELRSKAKSKLSGYAKKYLDNTSTDEEN